MDITKRLQELDPTLILHNEGHWDEPYDPNKPGFASFNDAGLEVEVGEFLYAMIRLLKPRNVLETGTHVGVGMSYMGQALKDNKKGNLLTIEFLPEIHARACQRRIDLKLEDYVSCELNDAIKIELGGYEFQMILLDTEPQTRFAELIKFFPYLEEGGYVFIHDLHRHMHQIDNEEHGFAWPYGPLPDPIIQMVNQGRLRPFHFDNPRGFTGFYKPAKGDYDWGRK